MSKRKAYRPKAVSHNTLFIAMQGAMLLSKADQAAAALRLDMAVTDVAKGVATVAQWQDIFDCLNLVNQLSRRPEIMRGAEDFVHTAQNVVVGILDRQKATGSMAVHAEELAVLRDLVSVWTDVLGVITHSDYFKAQERVAHRVRQVLASKRTDVRVVEVA